MGQLERRIKQMQLLMLSTVVVAVPYYQYPGCGMNMGNGCGMNYGNGMNQYYNNADYWRAENWKLYAILSTAFLSLTTLIPTIALFSERAH